jgi:hypothetical protein
VHSTILDIMSPTPAFTSRALSFSSLFSKLREAASSLHPIPCRSAKAAAFELCTAGRLIPQRPIGGL